jgi:carboxyl-terminal processing protease
MKRLSLIVTAAACLAAFPLHRDAAAAPNPNETYRALNLFGEVFTRVRADYVDKVKDNRLIDSAINGMLTSLDPHSNYLDHKDFSNLESQTQGEFGGLGIDVSMGKGAIRIVSPIDGTPAARAGLKPGDLIIRIDGKPVQGMSLLQATGKMRGPVGSQVTLTIDRKGQKPFKVTLTRATITVDPVHAKLEAGNIGYIRITSFTAQTDSGLDKAMKKLRQQSGNKLKGLVLDLRNNPGGLVDQAVAVANAFLDKGEIVSLRGREADDDERYDARPGADISGGLPMVVLINGGSASASEIVAGALKDQHRAVLLGTRSFGKGSVQTIIPLAGHGAMRLTTARYYTPSGRSIQDEGIEPNIIVPAGRVEASDATGKTTNPEGSVNPQILGTNQDYQLARALNVVRGIALFDHSHAAN